MNKALFLDRDGVINLDKGHVHLKQDFNFIEGIFDLCKKAQSKNFLLIVITNQAGIAKGFYNEECFHVLNKWMLEQFLDNGIKISQVYYCPHHENVTGKCLCRKPNPGMILKAKKEFKIDLKNSIFIGDKKTDMLAAENAGINSRILFLKPHLKSYESGHESQIVQSLQDIHF